MIFLGSGELGTEDGEPVLRSCWICNGSHEHLKKVNRLHECYECGNYWVFDRFFCSFENEDAFDAYFIGLGLKIGESTTKIDAGYRVLTTKITFASKKS